MDSSDLENLTNEELVELMNVLEGMDDELEKIIESEEENNETK